MQKWTIGLVGLVVVATLLSSGCGGSKETMTVGISYTLQPTEKLPEGLKTVAVNEAQVEATTESGEQDAIRAKKWSRMAADMVETMILDANKAKQTELTIAKRRETKEVMAEHDLAAAGMTQSNNAGAPPQLADIQGLIKSKFTIINDVQKGKQRTISGGSIAAWAGHAYGGGSGSVETEEVESVSRNLTVNCSFGMYDKAGNALFQYNQKVQKHDKQKPGAFFGSSKTEANLDPADKIIGELVEQGTREFVSMFAPTEVCYRYELESSSDENSAEGVRKMRGRFYDEAIRSFNAALAKESGDYKSMFCLAVAYELTGKYDDAINYYRQAASSKGVHEKTAAMYQSAADRLGKHKSRIAKSGK